MRIREKFWAHFEATCFNNPIQYKNFQQIFVAFVGRRNLSNCTPYEKDILSYMILKLTLFIHKSNSVRLQIEAQTIIDNIMESTQ